VYDADKTTCKRYKHNFTQHFWAHIISIIVIISFEKLRLQ